MASKRAESMDQASFWTVDTAGPPEKLCRSPMASPETGRMIGFAPFHGFIWGMSAQMRHEGISFSWFVGAVADRGNVWRQTLSMPMLAMLPVFAL